MRKKLGDISALSWTLVGTGLVLITLTGDTRRYGLFLAGIGLIIHLGALFVGESDDE